MSPHHPTPALRMRRCARSPSCAASSRPARRAGAADRPRADDGRAARGPPLADPRAPARTATWWSSRCSSTRPSSTRAPTSSATRAARTATRGWPRSGRRHAVRALRRGGLPARLRHLRRGARRERAPRGRGARAPSTSAASRRSSRSCSGMAQPDVAYFGQKDAQQVVVIRRLVADLNLPVRIEALPTVREPDGLAMSSRNALLDPQERRARARAVRGAGRRRPSWRPRASARAAGAARRPRRERSPRRASSPSTWRSSTRDTLEPLERLEGEALLAIAARVGGVRLIDNASPPPRPRRTSKPPRKGDRRRAARDAQVEDPPSHGHRL